MAFESYLNQDKTTRSKNRSLFQIISVAVHVAVILGFIIYGFWHVDELTPPNVTVTFMSAPPPPPPPPPPPKKKKSSKPKTEPKEIVQPNPDKVVQPKEEPEPEPEPEEDEGDDEGEDEGVEGGVVGGVVGGVIGGVVGGTAGTEQAKNLPPAVGNKQLLPGHKEPVPPPILARSGMIIFNMVKICVDKGGSIVSTTVVKKSDKLWDDACLKVINATYRYKPYTVNGSPVPFCSMTKFVMNASK